MKILVTGCMGFIGSNVVPSLLNSGHDVVGLDNLFQPSIRPTDRMKEISKGRWDAFKFYKGDIREHGVLETVFAHEGIDAVVHLAAVGSVPRSFSNPGLTTSVNIGGFVNVLTMAARFQVPRFVYASSSSVYGDSHRLMKTEGEEGNTLSPYALSKKMNEEFARIWAPAAHVNTVGLRFFNVYGPGQLPDSPYSAVIPRFITAPPVVHGDGSTTRDFTFVGDVARAIEFSLAYADKASTVVNVGTGVGTSLKKLLVYLEKTAKHQPERVGDIHYSIASVVKAKTEIGFEAETKIEDGIKITRAFYEKEATNGE